MEQMGSGAFSDHRPRRRSDVRGSGKNQHAARVPGYFDSGRRRREEYPAHTVGPTCSLPDEKDVFPLTIVCRSGIIVANDDLSHLKMVLWPSPRGPSDSSDVFEEPHKVRLPPEREGPPWTQRDSTQRDGRDGCMGIVVLYCQRESSMDGDVHYIEYSARQLKENPTIKVGSG